MGSQDFAKADMFSVGASLLEMCTGHALSGGGGDDSQEWHALRDGSMIEVICADQFEGRSEGGGRNDDVMGCNSRWEHRSLNGYSSEVKKVIREVITGCLVRICVVNNMGWKRSFTRMCDD